MSKTQCSSYSCRTVVELSRKREYCAAKLAMASDLTTCSSSLLTMADKI